MKELFKVLAVLGVIVLGIMTFLAIIMSAIALGYWAVGVPVKCAFVDCVTTPHGDSIVVEKKQ